MPCLPGRYQPRQGRGSCEMCPAGFYCQDLGKAVRCLNCFVPFVPFQHYFNLPLVFQFFSKYNTWFNSASTHQEWCFHAPVREAFTAFLVQQILIPVHQEPMETCQDWLRNLSAHCVIPACTVKEQVFSIRSSDVVFECYVQGSLNNKIKSLVTKKSLYFCFLDTIVKVLNKCASREDVPQWALCWRLFLCWRSLWTFTIRHTDRILVPSRVFLPCGNICTKTVPKRNIQVNIQLYIYNPWNYTYPMNFV